MEIGERYTQGDKLGDSYNSASVETMQQWIWREGPDLKDISMVQWLYDFSPSSR